MLRCMASTLVQTGFVRGSMTQGNGCYQQRCTNNSLEVNILVIFNQFSLSLCCCLKDFVFTSCYNVLVILSHYRNHNNYNVQQ
jgi:hypothetical protein